MWNSSQLPLWPQNLPVSLLEDCPKVSCHQISSTHFISSGTWPRRSWIPWNLLLGCTVTLCGTRVRQFCFWELLVRQPMVSTWSSRKRFCAASTAAYRCVDTATFFFSATSVSPLPYCDLRGLVEATRDCVQGLQRVNWLQCASASAR